MKILYISHFNSDDIKVLSGTIYHVRRMLENLGHEVIVVDDLYISQTYKYIKKVAAKVRGKDTLIEREPFVLKSFARQIKKKTKNLEYDLIFSPTSLYYAYYKDDKPMVYYSDATFGGMVDYYIFRENYSPKAISNGFEQEKRSISNSDLVILASEWAKRTAIESHEADPEKCVVVNRGANVKHKLKKEDIYALIDNKVQLLHQKNCTFMFLGTDWKRKGGPIAVKVVKLLNEKYGFHAKLQVIGCTPYVPPEASEYIDIIGYLNKGNPSEYAKLENIFKTSAFFLLPTRSEAQGISYTEACSWGVPVIGTNTGGVSGVICDNVNGFLMEENDQPEVYAERIFSSISDPESYRTLAKESYEYCLKNLTWDAVGKKIDTYLHGLAKKEKDRYEQKTKR